MGLSRSSSGGGITVGSLIEAIRRRFFALLLVSLTIFAASAVAVLLIQPKYIATTRIKIDPNQNALIGVATPRTATTDEAIDTEVSAMQSRDIAAMVITRLRLMYDPEFAPKKGAQSPGPQSPTLQMDATVNKLLDGVAVRRERATYVVNISFKSINPKKSAQIANAFAEAYMSNSVGARTGTATRQVEFLTERLKAAGAELAKVESQAAQYKAQAGVIGAGAGGSYSGTVADQQVAARSTQLATAESTASAAQAKLAVARQQMQQGGLDGVSAVLASPVVTDLRRQRAEVVRDMGSIQARYGPKHPETLRVEQQVQQLDEQIDQEARRVIGGLASEAAAESAKASSLRGQMGQLRGEQSANARAGVLAQSIQLKADAQRDTYNRLAGELQQATALSRNTQTQAQVIEQAVPPLSPSFPNKKLLLAIGLLAGLGAGFITVAVLELMSHGLRTTEGIETELGIPCLASIPALGRAALKRNGEQISPADLLIDQPVIPFSEAFRGLRNTLLQAKKNRPVHILSFVSALPNEGKTTSVLSMARTMALCGDKVLLIDGDVRKAGLSSLLSIHREKGLIELLQGEAAADDVIFSDIIEGLDILPVTTPSFTGKDLFGSARMQDVIASLKTRYDHIVIDTPPLLGVVDARALAALSDAVVLLVKWNGTPVKATKAALSYLVLDKAPIIGAAFTMVDPRSEALGSGYYGAAYAKYYQTATA